ncbi:uncharacterized protein LOC132549271 [Ylistrum balloti]|uniref:uncharacterized protein LOC132549271 n=1 Tax=Ylistrum balloti TaxID=509963 RepID=UPI0029057DB9|nr:uncharacterized protein LOC132549271 [Ylistrum balloti]
MSWREIGRQLNITHTVISRLIRKHVATGNVQDRQRSGRPRKTMARDDRMLLRLARQEPRSASRTLRDRWQVNARLSLSTLKRRLKAGGLSSRRPIRRPLLT